MSEAVNDTLLGSVKKYLDAKKNIHITFPDGGQLVVSGAQRLFLQTGCRLDLMVTSEKDDIRLRSISNSSASLEAVLSRGRDVNELLWMLAFQMSGGSLLKGLAPTDVFSLIRWPNFSRLPHTGNCLRIAALVSQRPTSVPMVGRILDIPRTDVYRFYSAASVSGCTALVNKGGEVVPIRPHKQQSVISALLEKLRRA